MYQVLKRSSALLISCALTTGAFAQQTLDQTATAANHVGFELFKNLKSEKSNGNRVFSPYSAYVFLSMLAQAADGDTQKEIKKILSAENVSDEDLADANLDYVRALLKTAKDFKLNVANSVWTRANSEIEGPFDSVMKISYHAQVEALDEDLEKAAQTINQWASKETNNLIENIVTPADLQSISVMIANATYFEALWISPFDPDDTEEGSFHKSANEELKPLFMEKSFGGDGKYVKVAGSYESIVLPYGNPKSIENLTNEELLRNPPKSTVAMVLVKPEGDLNTFINSLTARKLSDINSKVLTKELPKELDWTKGIGNGHLKMPKVDFGYSVENVEETLRSQIPLVFTPLTNPNRPHADLSKLSTTQALYLSEVKADTYLVIDEKGTKAAQIIRGGATTASPHPPQEFDLVLDKPFLFSIVHIPTNTLLFVGAISHPTGGKLPEVVDRPSR